MHFSHNPEPQKQEHRAGLPPAGRDSAFERCAELLRFDRLIKGLPGSEFDGSDQVFFEMPATQSLDNLPASTQTRLYNYLVRDLIESTDGLSGRDRLCLYETYFAMLNSVFEKAVMKQELRGVVERLFLESVEHEPRAEMGKLRLLGLLVSDEFLCTAATESAVIDRLRREFQNICGIEELLTLPGFAQLRINMHSKHSLKEEAEEALINYLEQDPFVGSHTLPVFAAAQTGRTDPDPVSPESVAEFILYFELTELQKEPDYTAAVFEGFYDRLEYGDLEHVSRWICMLPRHSKNLSDFHSVCHEALGLMERAIYEKVVNTLRSDDFNYEHLPHVVCVVNNFIPERLAESEGFFCEVLGAVRALLKGEAPAAAIVSAVKLVPWSGAQKIGAIPEFREKAGDLFLCRAAEFNRSVEQLAGGKIEPNRDHLPRYAYELSREGETLEEFAEIFGLNTGELRGIPEAFLGIAYSYIALVDYMIEGGDGHAWRDEIVQDISRISWNRAFDVARADALRDKDGLAEMRLQEVVRHIRRVSGISPDKRAVGEALHFYAQACTDSDIKGEIFKVALGYRLGIHGDLDWDTAQTLLLYGDFLQQDISTRAAGELMVDAGDIIIDYIENPDSRDVRSRVLSILQDPLVEGVLDTVNDKFSRFIFG